MQYVFYFDESFHDRKITINADGKFNILDKNALDNYIGVFWGCPQKLLYRNIDLLNTFELEQKRIFGLREDEELKSTTIGKKNFEHGICSFNRNAFYFYQQLFTLICEVNPIIQINAISKMEFFIRKALAGIEFPQKYSVEEKSFYYSITKLLIVYKHDELITALYNAKNSSDIEELRKRLINTLDIIIEATHNIPRKERELIAFSQLRRILTDSKLNISINTKLDFRYFPNFDGLCSLLQEIEIKPQKIKLVIDDEEKTFIEAQRYSFGKTKQANSKNVIQLHLSDFISGFIGRMMYAISNDKSMVEDSIADIRNIYENDLESKRLLSPQWFAVTDEQFELYRLVYKALIGMHQHYWTIQTMSYADQAVSFCSLLKHFAAYDDFAAYQRIEPEMHSEYFNARCCEELDSHYTHMRFS